MLDVTDHVWCEAWSESESRWVHCDPCEGVADTPLMYESGWRKRLSHVLAFGRAHCADVSRRYTLCWRSALARREPVPEGWLELLVASHTARAAGGLSAAARAVLRARLAAEEVEYIYIYIYIYNMWYVYMCVFIFMYMYI